MRLYEYSHAIETGNQTVYNKIMECIIVGAGGREIAVEVERKRVRNINLRVRADGSVHVSAPSRVPMKRIEDFVLSRAAWIAKKTAAAEAREKFSFVAEGYVPFLGRRLPLTVTAGERVRVTAADDGVNVCAPSPESADKAVSKWLLNRAKEVLPALFAEAQAETNGRFGAPVQPRVVRMRARWGCCERTKRLIKLNALIVTAPEECVRYVCLHELAHLERAGHDAEFHALLEELCPGHRALKRRLDAECLRKLPQI